MVKISWHPEAEQVVSRLDRIGGIILMLYIAVEVGRKWLFGHWLQGAELNAFGLIFLGGLLLGRLASMRRQVRRVLAAEAKLAPTTTE